MIWQDVIVMIATLGLSIAIIPTLRSASKPPLTTCIGFAICVLVIGGALVSAGLWLGGAANLVGGSLWAVVAVQILKQRRSFNT